MDTSHGTPLPGPGNGPAAELVAPGSPITDPCGCNQPGATHQRGDQAFCRATLVALGAP